jgi:hypothetical protein
VEAKPRQTSTSSICPAWRLLFEAAARHNVEEKHFANFLLPTGKGSVMTALHACRLVPLFIVCLLAGYDAKAASPEFSFLAYEYDKAYEEAEAKTKTQVEWPFSSYMTKHSERARAFEDQPFRFAITLLSTEGGKLGPPRGKASEALLRQMASYRDRIEMLKNLPLILAGDLPAKGPFLRIDDFLKQYDFALRLFSPCPETYLADLIQRNFDCHGFGQVLIYRKGEIEAIKTINTFLRVITNGGGSVLDAEAFKRNGAPLLRTFDLNFDGYEDVVIYNGYKRYEEQDTVYLFDPVQKNLVYNEGFSNVMRGSNYLDVELDASRKLIVLNESGESCSSANYSRHRQWKVTENQPVLVREVITDADYCENGKDACIKTEEKNFVDGQWRSKFSYEPYTEEEMGMEEPEE